jgi:RNA polymerase sigma-70 factor, ECF subfamily
MTASSAAHARKVQEVQRLFLRNAGLLRGFILGLLPDHNQAEDVFQDVFLTAAAKADDFRDGSNFPAWVRAIARLKVLEHCRRQKALPHLLDPAALEAVIAAAADLDDAWAPRREALAYCIKRLSPRAREILELRYSDEFLPPRRIAERLRWSLGAVHVALSRARKFLQECTQRRLAWREV